jgi:hypothetical protein
MWENLFFFYSSDHVDIFLLSFVAAAAPEGLPNKFGRGKKILLFSYGEAISETKSGKK